MKTLSNFLATLSGIRPIKARRLILDGGLLSENERADIHRRDTSLLDTVLEVGPDAAAAILAAYKAGRLPMQKGLRPTSAPDAEAYLATSDALRTQIAERRRQENAINDPSLILESDFGNHRLMDRVFFANVGPGAGSMTLAGITVTKTVIGYQSNSGKNTGWRVRLDWIGSDGEARRSESVPPEANNRRNDAARNWGLPE